MISTPFDNQGISPVSRVAPVLAVAAIGDATQELDFRALQFTKGQEYFARVMSRVDDTSFNVNVDGTLLKMNLGSNVQVGQQLQLKYINDTPLPTFLLAQAGAKLPESSINLSPAASLIGKYLQQAQQAGASDRLQATAVVTQTPGNPQLMAQDLRHAISNSGLFYESHMSELVQGQRSLSAILQEPQNQPSPAALASQQAVHSQPSQVAALMAQQLTLLENQRMAWHGEVWPGQQMDWDIYRHQEPRDNKPAASVQDELPVTSELTLHLPHLGKVKATLQLSNGRMRINIQAHEQQALQVLKQHSPALVSAMEKNGQALAALTLASDE